jgi:hypothetical protein
MSRLKTEEPQRIIAPPNLSSSLALETHYSVADVSRFWNMSTDTVRRIFRDEPGVVVVAHGDRRGRRSYRTLRIPESVLLRVHRQKSNALYMHK